VQIVWCGSNDVLTCARGFTKVSTDNKGEHNEQIQTRHNDNSEQA
jgi:hypothetical protein